MCKFIKKCHSIYADPNFADKYNFRQKQDPSKPGPGFNIDNLKPEFMANWRPKRGGSIYPLIPKPNTGFPPTDLPG
jgi:hypothetical protein